MAKNIPTDRALRAENAALRARLEEAEEALRAIRAGEVDALVVEGANGPQVFTLQGAEAESSQFRGEILAQIGEAVLAVDRDQHVIYLNSAAERLYGVAASEALGRSLPELYEATPISHGRDRDLTPPLNDGGTWRAEQLQRTRDGRHLQVELSETSLLNSAGQPAGRLSILRDISERRRIEDNLRELASQLSEVDRKKDEFLAILAHELRNPLAPLRTGLEILKRIGNQAGPAIAARDMMERALTQTVRLVDDLLDLSRISRGKLQLRQERIELANVIATAVELSRTFIDEKHQELSIALPPETVSLDGDPARLAQVIANLLNNAAKYSSEGGQICLSAARHDGEVRISIVDNGVGVGSADLGRIFDMFAQVDTTLEKSQGGLGIGLSLAKQLVEMHGGRIEARSEGVGKGSEFIVRLPVVPSGEWRVASEGKEGASGQWRVASPENFGTNHSPLATSSLATVARGKRILIVDDNHASADTLAMLLEFDGHKIVKAYDGEQALALAETFQPEIILLDIGMPKLNGYEVARSLRAKPWGRSMIIIAMSGWGQEKDQQRARDSGFDHHLIKPVNLENLAKLLGELGSATAASA